MEKFERYQRLADLARQAADKRVREHAFITLEVVLRHLEGDTDEAAVRARELIALALKLRVAELRGLCAGVAALLELPIVRAELVELRDREAERDDADEEDEESACEVE